MDAIADADRVVANPKDPASTYAYGRTHCLTLNLTNGPVFRPGETKRLKSGLSVATKAPAVICVARRVLDPQRPCPFSTKFTYLEDQTDLVNVTTSVTNESASPRTHRTPDNNMGLSVFALPLTRFSINPLPLFSSSTPDVRLKMDRAPFRVITTPTNKNVAKLVLKNQKWVKTNRTAFGTHITSIVFKIPGLKFSDYDSVHATAISEPGVRIDRSEVVGTPADNLRIYLIFDPKAPAASDGPPSSLSIQLNFFIFGSPHLLRKNPEPLLVRRPDNGYDVRCPRTVYVKTGDTTKIVIDNACWLEHGYIAVFFPRDIPGADLKLAFWRMTKPLSISVTARRDVKIPYNAILGRIHFFPSNSPLFSKTSASNGVDQSQVHIQILDPDNEPETPPPPRPPPPTREGTEDRNRDEGPNENAIPIPHPRPFGIDYPYDRHAGDGPVPDNDDDDGIADDTTTDFANLSLGSAPAQHRSRHRRPLSEVPPRRSDRDGRFDAFNYNLRNAAAAEEDELNALLGRNRDDDDDEDGESFEDFVAGPFQVAIANAQEEEDSSSMILHLGPHFLSFNVDRLEPIMFTMYTPLLTETVFFAEPGIDKMLTSFAVTGRFLTAPERKNERQRPEENTPQRQ